MASDSWETAAILQRDAVICRDQGETKMEVQIRVASCIRMLF